MSENERPELGTGDVKSDLLRYLMDEKNKAQIKRVLRLEDGYQIFVIFQSEYAIESAKDFFNQRGSVLDIMPDGKMMWTTSFEEKHLELMRQAGWKIEQ
jgi:hypothetical protein